jgi:hypothetical protein
MRPPRWRLRTRKGSYDRTGFDRRSGAAWSDALGKGGFKPERLCPPEFKAKLKTHKAELLTLLQAKGVTWIEVHSERIGETIFFADEATKAALIEAGAEEWSIYTKDELRILCEQNRVAPLSPDELRKVHQIKRTFNGRIAK